MAKKNVVRTTRGVRDRLFDVLDGLRDGTITPQEAQASARVVQQIHNTTRLEIEAARFISQHNRADDGDSNVIELTPLRLAHETV